MTKYIPITVLVAVLAGCGGNDVTYPTAFVGEKAYCTALTEIPALSSEQANDWNTLGCAEILAAAPDAGAAR